MNMNETTFENVRVGDRVFSPLFKSNGEKTNATIQNIFTELMWPISVKPDNAVEGLSCLFNFNGEYNINGGQVLFWENPIKEIPARPKRMVIKKGWIGILPVRNMQGQGTSHPVLGLTTNIFLRKEDVGEGRQMVQVEFEMEEKE